MRLFVAVLIILILLPSVLFAENDQDIWLTANTAYDNSNFQTAIDNYLKLLERGIRTPEIYYNLGNAYFKIDQIGLSIAAFRHSLQIDHSFEPARENLEYVRKYTVDKVEEKPRGFLLNLWYNATGFFSPQGYFIFTLASFWALIALLSVFILGFSKKELLTYLLILLAIVFMLSSVVTYSVVDKELNTKWGVLTATSAELREGPGEDFERIFTGHEGLEFKILSQRQNYYLVELKSGLKGWIKSSLLTEI